MGDPKKHRKKYETPLHPWQQARMQEETTLRREFGLRTKTEIWKLRTTWRRWARQAKKLNALHTQQAELETRQLLQKLIGLGLLTGEASLNDVLDIELPDLFRRRLQSIVVDKKLARNMKQARQFITHRHVMVNSQIVTAPSYLVSVEEEPTVTFTERSALASADHPERIQDEGETTATDA